MRKTSLLFLFLINLKSNKYKRNTLVSGAIRFCTHAHFNFYSIMDGIGLEFGLKLVRHLNFVGKYEFIGRF